MAYVTAIQTENAVMTVILIVWTMKNITMRTLIAPVIKPAAIALTTVTTARDLTQVENAVDPVPDNAVLQGHLVADLQEEVEMAAMVIL